MPDQEEMTLEEPEIIKQGGRYGVRLRASAPSIHMMRADIRTTVSPIVGTERQSEELVMYLLEGFEEDPTKIWSSNISESRSTNWWAKDCTTSFPKCLWTPD